MRVVKIIAWIFILYIIRTAFGGIIGIWGTAPELLLAFSVIYSFSEWNYSFCTYVMLACGILAGSGVGSSFPADVLIIGAASIAARVFSEHAKFIPGFVRVQTLVIAASAILGTAEYFISYKSFAVNVTALIIYMVYTLVCSCIMYPIIIKTLFPKEKKKLFVV